MKIIFCSDPLEPKLPDAAFRMEVDAAARNGFESAFIDFELLVNAGDPSGAVRRVRATNESTLSIYRGWMLKPKQYQQLFDALLIRGHRLINDPTAYQHCHYLPEAYLKIEGHTPRSVWMRVDSQPPMDQVMELLQPFGSAAIIVKDFVKSRKHEWNEACFIPSASDQLAVERVVRRFLELQDDDLNEGLVFREFVEFEPLTTHARSGMPLTKEFRLFYFDGQLSYSCKYWDQGDYHDLQPPLDRFAEIARQIESRFFSMDVAKRRDGDWLIMELGDGQVAGLPENADVDKFYSLLAKQWPDHGKQ
jgi:hypothetical protein